MSKNQSMNKSNNNGVCERALVTSAVVALFSALTPSVLAHTIEQQPTTMTVQVERVTDDRGTETRYYSFVEDGKSVTVELRDGQVTRATIDDKDVPSDRVTLDEGTLKIVNEKQERIFEKKLAITADPRTRITAPTPPPPPPMSSRWRAGWSGRVPSGEPGGWVSSRSVRGAGSAEEAGEPGETPKVMIGVQLAEPDDSLRGHLGLKEGEATFVTVVQSGLPADKAGIAPYDVIVAINGARPAGSQAVREAIRGTEAGKTISFTVLRKGEERDVQLSPVAYDAALIEKSERKSVNAARAFGMSFGPQFDEEMAKAMAHGFAAGGSSPFVALAPAPPAPPGGPGAPGQIGGTTPAPPSPRHLWFGSGASPLDPGSREELQEMVSKLMEQIRTAANNEARAAIEADMAARNARRLQPGDQDEDRLDRMERMLQQLLEERAKEAGKPGGKKTSDS